MSFSTRLSRVNVVERAAALSREVDGAGFMPRSTNKTEPSRSAVMNTISQQPHDKWSRLFRRTTHDLRVGNLRFASTRWRGTEGI
jgi:hypothetical protein